MMPTVALAALAIMMLFAAPARASAEPLQDEVFPELILERLELAGLPIRAPVIFTAETDPNDRLGRPGQYFAKASRNDARVSWRPGDGVPDVESGGTLELFHSTAARDARRDYLAAFDALFPQYQYARAPVLLRVSHHLTPDQAADYERVLLELTR